MKFHSTRDSKTRISLSDAIKQGLASDGGLFVPEVWPKIADPSWAGLELPQLARMILAPFFAGDILSKDLDLICRNAFDFPVPVVQLDETTSILELFHGPTAAFKDFGARFLANSLANLPNSSGKAPLVLVATSGDTGGAVAAAFAQYTKTEVVILFPKGRISKRQELQLTTWGSQVRAFAVEGTFDDCQKIVKEALISPHWRNKYDLISANSINLGRLLPQMCYFAFASTNYARRQNVVPDLIVPSGNLGDSVAALWAKKIGFPIGRVGLAHNQNDAVATYFATGVWSPKPSVETLANAMDVGNPSNFERLKFLYPDWQEMLRDVAAISVTDNEIRETIRYAYKTWRQVICPHTAAALTMRELDRKTRPKSHVIITATAHPAKFETTVEPLTGQIVSVPVGLQELMGRPSQKEVIVPQLSVLESKLWHD